MKTINKLILLPIGLGAVLLVLLIAGCQPAASQSAPAIAGQDSAAPTLLSTADERPATQGKSRGQLWSQTCNRCHNTRSPDSYSSREWAIVMTHMRVRGYLTGEDQRAILEFLQSQ